MSGGGAGPMLEMGPNYGYDYLLPKYGIPAKSTSGNLHHGA